MIRGILVALSTRASNIVLKSYSRKGGAQSLISKTWLDQSKASFSSVVSYIVGTRTPQNSIKYGKCMFLEPPRFSVPQIRTVIKHSLKKGRRKSVTAVRDRYFRLHWGIWIRTIAGRHKKLWKKSAGRRNRMLNHVFCNATQSKMFDTMVNKFWRKPRYYIEDPYEPYHKRENFGITSRKPWRPEGVDYE